MPVFFFDVSEDGAINHSDPLGTEIPKADIPDEAVGMISCITADRLPDGLKRIFSVSVRDEAGGVVFKATLSLIAGWQ